MVESFASSVEDKLVDGLSFKLRPGASYVTNRRSVTFHPQGSNHYKAGTGTKLIKFQLSGDDWLDPSTVRIAFDLVNEDENNKRLRPLGGPHSFFQRMRVLAGGQVIEDIDNWNRVSEMFQCLKNKSSRENESSEAFGFEWDSHEYKRVQVIQTGADVSVDGPVKTVRAVRDFTFPGIPAKSKQRVLFKPLSGILNQPKFLPIRYMPLTFELDLVASATEPILGGVYGSLLDDMDGGNTSELWHIENVEIKADLITLDNGLDNSYAEHLLSGKSLPINYNTFVSQMQHIAGQQKPGVNVTRALTRLKSVFVTLDKDYSTTALNGSPGKKHWNTFHSPMSLENDDTVYQHSQDGEFNFYIQIGSKLFPEYPIRSHSEAFYQLMKTLGIQSSNVHSFDITPRQFRDNKMILGIDTEKVLEAGYTGLNTRSGDLMRIVLENATDNVNRLADRMHIVLHSDQIVEIRDTGVQVYD